MLHESMRSTIKILQKAEIEFDAINPLIAGKNKS